jgi:glycosyltransferase involved in cell wall biosynthesis
MIQKALLITNIPTPYRIPLFNVLHEELASRGIGFKVIFGALGYGRRQWRIDMQDCLFPHEVLPTAHLRFSDPERAAFTYEGLFGLLQREQPGVIIANGFSVATTKLWFRSVTHHEPYLIWSGAISGTARREHWLRRLHRKLLIRRATGFVAYGSRARDYLLELGAAFEGVRIGINTVDTSFYGTAAQLRDNGYVDQVPKHLIYVGHLTQGKKIDRLLRIVKNLSMKRDDFVLKIIGSGSEEANLKLLSQQLSLQNIVHFEGFKQRDEVLRYLASAYCFLFPSVYDVWGLVLVEAMAAGLPCVSSLDAGATCDLIQEGQTGFAVDFCEIDGVTEKLHWLLDHPAQCELMGQRARNFIEEQVTLKKSAEGFVAAIERALEQQR